MQIRRKFGSASLPSSSIFRFFDDASGKYSFDTTAASTTPPTSAVQRSRSPPTAASVTSEGAMLNFARATRANMSGNEPGADTAMDLPLRSSILSIPALTMMPCVDDDPVATHDLHVAAAHARRDGALGAAFVAVEFAGKQRFEPDLVVFDFEQFELEALAFRKAALGRHQQEAGIGLGRDDPVFPWFR